MEHNTSKRSHLTRAKSATALIAAAALMLGLAIMDVSMPGASGVESWSDATEVSLDTDYRFLGFEG